MNERRSAMLDEPNDHPDDVHVSPTYGREHESSVRCWCGPTRDLLEPHVLVHRDPN